MNTHDKSSAPRAEIAGRSLRLHAKASDASAIELPVEQRILKRNNADEMVVEIKAAAVNPSDVKAAIGMMPYAVFPRTPGRDFAGVVVEGPSDLVGREVFGSSGDLGIRRDGTHASYLVVEAAAVVVKPLRISIEEAAGIGVPFVTAMEGLKRAGMPKSGETVLILGLNGKVGQAAAQIAAWRGAHVIGAMRGSPSADVPAGIEVIDATRDDVAVRARELTSGRGADIVYNTVGEPYYEAGQKALAVLGRMIFIAAFKQTVPFDIFSFYRGRHTYVGIDTLALSSVATGEVLRELIPGFESGALRPFPIAPNAIYPLERAKEAYLRVLESSRDRLVLAPGR